MASFNESFHILMKLEFSNPANYLHKNTGENDFTVGGIYRTAHPNWIGWDAVALELQMAGGNVASASVALYSSPTFTNMVKDFYRAHFWLRMKLDQIDSQRIVNELFVFGVNAGCRNAIRKAQKVIGVTADGLIGPVTIAALNAYPPQLFDMQFDEIEMQFYDDLIERRPALAIFRNGWRNRSNAV